MRGVSVLVAGAGLAGLTAAYELQKNGAKVTLIEAQPRVGGRVRTVRDFQHRQHAEAGGDLIDEGQEEIAALARELGLERVQILPRGFTGVRQVGRRTITGRMAWYELGRALAPEIRAFCLSEQRANSAVGEELSRLSVANWLDRIHASAKLRATATAFRGFFLADPQELSLIALVEQFAEDGIPGGERMFRLKGGNDRLPTALAARLKGCLELETILRSVSQSSSGVSVGIERHGRLAKLEAEYFVSAIPATTARKVQFDPALPPAQSEAIATLKYGAATKTSLQFARATWRRRGKASGYGTNLPVGAVWDGSDDQRGEAGILSLLAGGNASRQTQELLASGPESIVRQLTWMNVKDTPLLAWHSVSWESDPWVRGGYAYFDPAFKASNRDWLARPFGRVFFAGEHTSTQGQGYMNGAVQTGLRAAEEIAAHVRMHRNGPPEGGPHR